ncbi:uncharacterized protein DEA37_0002928 [Paragonimus westermani]|uniref:Uncharacterized protein n=1 Tax=Paragonimus westermani TaxID=34504 RepID=A0A5J4NCW9_9TREM|nr:uncharacterized protein DEA37_0002928 [Paragonimus westermani]
MKVFSRYEVVDTDKRLVSVGLKASFCLEDNICKPGATPKFRCSNVIDRKGTQGKTLHRCSPPFKDTEHLLTEDEESRNMYKLGASIRPLSVTFE